ncbi:P-loop NTPase fold protein [Shewanella sp. HL-SH4]|jgi:hypothetical protein|uniref:P-loop NTPase fold protein n=1 Tax=Shewanella sp. HL-SH4 TaxID=3436240 RepID=UPI003EBB4104|tara:strand:- start:271 stop:3597 length:3327 start_codon:yes stop_codon:yes gene_type:complete
MSTIRKYQNEKPVETDLFGGQGHSQVAGAIANVLLNDSTQHIIGIEGNLGAGKSTVINILKQQVQDKGFQIVTFDADQYHTTLKPALILTIEAELKILLGKKNHSQLIELNKAVEIAMGRRLEYTKATTSHISFSAIVFAFSLGISALQIKPSIKFLFELTQKDPNLDKLSGVLSVGLFLLPALVYGIMKLFGIKTRLGDLVKRNSTDTISETIDINREVGAIELRETFNTFAKLIPQDKTLLLVIDNIDRVSPDIARELWSDIEILTSLGSERFRILLPYSEEHLAKALEKSAVDESQSGKEFISKRIPIPFSAPPIVATGWREQFDKYWEQTLPDIEGMEGVKTLIDIWGKRISPRYLKSLVNRVGSKIDSCPEDNNALNGACCAAYIMAVRDNNILVTELLSELNQLTSSHDIEKRKELDRKLKATHKVLRKYGGAKEDWSRQIAALHFQTSFEIAQSELIAEPIRTAFSISDTQALMKLKPLLGFDVFFKQQIESTNSKDLIKIAASIAEEKSGHELLNTYLKDINHEVKETESEDYEYDDELVSSYKILAQNNIKIDLTLAKKLQNNTASSISTMWQLLSSLKSPNENNTAEDLEKALRECYAYSSITDVIPRFITKPDASFVVNALYPIENQLKRWNIKKIIESLPMDLLVVAACKRQEAFNEVDTIFPVLLENMRIGELDNIETDKLLSNSEVSTTDMSTLLQVLPFSKEWNNSSRSTLSLSLAQHLENLSANGSLDDNKLAAYTALITAAFMSGFEPTANFNLQNAQRRGQSHQTTDWLISKLKITPEYSEYLTNYLSTCKFKDILKWCKHEPITEYLSKNLADLIKERRVHVMDISDLLKTDYSFLKSNLDETSPEDILNWMSGWSKHAKDPLSWGDVVVDDILRYQPKQLLQVLIGYFDNDHLTKEAWSKLIKEHHSSFKKVVRYLTTLDKPLEHQRHLQEALKVIPEETHNYDVELVTGLLDLIDNPKKNGISTTLRSNFFKTTTPNEQRCRSIQYFGALFKMPNIKDEDAAQEATVLLSYVIANRKTKELEWLLSQSIQGSGWNIDSLSQESLIGLHDALKEDDTAVEHSLAKEIKSFLNESEDNNEAYSTGVPAT